MKKALISFLLFPSFVFTMEKAIENPTTNKNENYLPTTTKSLHDKAIPSKQLIKLLSDTHYTKEQVQELLNKGADVTIQNEKGWTSLDCTEGWTPLHFAAQDGNVNVCTMLIDHHALVDARNRHKATPLVYAVLYERSDVCRLLLQCGAHVNSQDESKATPLHLAAGMGYMDICELLLQYNAQVDIMDWESKTPLHYAAEKGKVDCCLMLLQHDAHPDAGGLKYGRMPLVLAAKKGHTQTCLALMSRMIIIPPLEKIVTKVLPYGETICFLDESPWRVTRRTTALELSTKPRLITALSIFKCYRVPRNIAYQILSSNKELADDVFYCLLPLINRLYSEHNLSSLSKIIPLTFRKLTIRRIYNFIMHVLEIELQDLESNEDIPDQDDIRLILAPKIVEDLYGKKILASISLHIGFNLDDIG